MSQWTTRLAKRLRIQGIIKSFSLAYILNKLWFDFHPFLQVIVCSHTLGMQTMKVVILFLLPSLFFSSFINVLNHLGMSGDHDVYVQWNFILLNVSLNTIMKRDEPTKFFSGKKKKKSSGVLTHQQRHTYTNGAAIRFPTTIHALNLTPQHMKLSLLHIFFLFDCSYIL